MMYYCLLTAEQLSTAIPPEIVAYMGYNKAYLLSEVIFGQPSETVDGLWLCCCALRNAKYVENNCIENYANEAELDMWRQYVGADNVFSDISNIILKPIEK